MIKAIVVSYGEVQEAVEFATQAELDAFTSGVIVGASMFGGGDFEVLTKDTDFSSEEFKDCPPRTINALKALIEKHLK